MTKIELIHHFLQKDEPIAIVGVSRNPKKFGRYVFEKLKKLGYELYPINPLAETINDTKCYQNIASLPSNTKKLIIITHKSSTDNAIEEAAAKNIQNIWVQQMSDTDNTLDIAAKHNINLIVNECIFMFAAPRGIHKIHRIAKQIFGTMPS